MKSQIVTNVKPSEGFLKSTLDTLSANIAVLDETGYIIFVNKAWRDFAEQNGLSADLCSEGINYLQVCDVSREWSEEAKYIADGIRKIFSGELSHFGLECPCHTPNKERWFHVKVTSFLEQGETRVVISHENITERKQNEETSKKIYNNTHDAIIIHDRNGKIIDVNNRMCQIYNLNEEEAIACTIEDISSRNMRVQDLSEIWAKVLRGEKQFFEWEAFRPKDRNIFYVEVSLEKIDLYNEFFIIANVRDVTKGKQREKTLRQSENYYRAIFETSGSAIFILEQDTTISHVNSNFEEISGYSRREIEGKKYWTELVHPDDITWMKEYHFLRRQNSRAAPQSYEFRFINRNGEVRQGYLTVDMIPETTQSVVSLVDITERKQAKEDLQRSENYYRSIFETSGTAMLIIEQDTTISIVNSNFEELTGYPRQELEGKKSFLEFMHSEDLDWMKENHYKRRQDPYAAPRRYEFRFVTRYGETRNMFLAVDMIPGTNQSFASGIDITEHKQAEEVLQQSENYYRSIFETSGAGMFIMEEDTTISHVNSRLFCSRVNHQFYAVVEFLVILR